MRPSKLDRLDRFGDFLYRHLSAQRFFELLGYIGQMLYLYGNQLRQNLRAIDPSHCELSLNHTEGELIPDDQLEKPH